MTRIHPSYFEHRKRVGEYIMKFTETIPDDAYIVELLLALQQVQERLLQELARGDVYQIYRKDKP